MTLDDLPSLARIALAEAAFRHDLRPEELLAKSRTSRLQRARKWAMVCLRAIEADGKPLYSCDEIGAWFGVGRAAVSHATSRHNGRLDD